MPGCAAVGCNNRSEKGYIMKCFPRDPKLRKIWEERVARADWKASNNSFLCHMHFEPQEWSVTKSGRIRLRKNAVPSIFTITSTRKSAKKRIKLPIAQKNNKFQYTVIEYLEKRIDRDSDFRDSDDFSSDAMDDCLYSDTTELKNKGNGTKLHVKKDPDMDDNVIIISDDDWLDVNSIKCINDQEKLNDRNNALKPLLPQKNADPVQTSNAIVKEEVKSEIVEQVILDDSYDEIEEKLKQICDGGCAQDENVTKENNVNSTEKDTREVSATSEISNNNIVISDVESNDFKKNCINNATAKKPGNVEIIFGVESGEEKKDLCHSNKDSTVKLDKTNESTVNFNETVNIKEEKKVFTEDIEENFARDEVHVIPNMRAAMKRKRRTREEIMKSIKKSIKNTSDQEGSSSSSGLTIVTDQETELGDDLSRSPCQIMNATSENAVDAPAKFIIKVTGDPSDVEEIMDELTSNTITKSPLQKLVVPHMGSQNSELVTSVFTIYSSLSSKDSNDSDTNVNSSKNVCATPNRTSSIEPTNSGSSVHHPSFCRHSLTSLEDEDRNVTGNSNTCKQCCLHTQTSVAGSSSSVFPAESDKLMVMIRLQEEVIRKLTDQIILYKEFENNIRGKNPTRVSKDIDISTHKMNTRSSTAQLASSVKRNLEWKQKLIEDLSNRVNFLEELNKKLMKTVTIESQQRRHLEGQLKQKDNRIKELNWKLEKASKYLERAEKNTNTYRRKMLNMQTIIRRKKVLDEKVCKFNEILTDTNAKQEYSEKDYAMAVQVRKSCGKVGYEKLLSYGFSLPPLSNLQRRLSADDAMDYESNEDKSPEVSKENSKIETIKNSSNEIDSKFSELNSKEVDFDGAETVTGTVQDIFDENNDGDDFSTNELREHFILQLNAVM